MKKTFKFLLASLLACGSLTFVPTNVNAATFSTDKTTYSGYTKVSYEKLSAVADSEETSGEGAINGRASTLVDGNINTFYHSKYYSGNGNSPVVNNGYLTSNNTITVTLEEATDLKGITVVPRQDAYGNGCPIQLDVAVSTTDDGDDFTTVVEDYFIKEHTNPSTYSKDEKEVAFNEVQAEVKRFKITFDATGTSEINFEEGTTNSSAFICLAEVGAFIDEQIVNNTFGIPAILNNEYFTVSGFNDNTTTEINMKKVNTVCGLEITNTSAQDYFIFYVNTYGDYTKLADTSLIKVNANTMRIEFNPVKAQYLYIKASDRSILGKDQVKVLGAANELVFNDYYANNDELAAVKALNVNTTSVLFRINDASINDNVPIFTYQGDNDTYFDFTVNPAKNQFGYDMTNDNRTDETVLTTDSTINISDGNWHVMTFKTDANGNDAYVTIDGHYVPGNKWTNSRGKTLTQFADDTGEFTMQPFLSDFVSVESASVYGKSLSTEEIALEANRLLDTMGARSERWESTLLHNDNYVLEANYAADKETSLTFAESFNLRYVSKDVLSVKAQAKKVGDNYTVRFVSSVASLNLDEVGFDVTLSNGKTGNAKSNTVYTSISAENDFVNPTIFNEASQYFYTFKLTNIPADQKDLTIDVTPYWYTNGVKVNGRAATYKLETLFNSVK